MDDTLQRIADILSPIQDDDWHGKWRIKKVLELCSNKQLLPKPFKCCGNIGVNYSDCPTQNF